MSLMATSGLSYLNQLKKRDHRIQSHLKLLDGAPVVAAPGKKPVSAGEKWINLDDPCAVLHFESYVPEMLVNGTPQEKVSVRLFSIYYYLEDDTMMIMEEFPYRKEQLREKFMRRQKVSRNNQLDVHINVWDLNVGKNVTIHGRTHHIYKCDAFTRKTMGKIGFEVPEDITPPYDQKMATSAADHKLPETLARHINPEHQFAKFLKLDGYVLRFQAIWDDRGNMYGDKHKLVVHFFLADDTMEVLRWTPQPTGRDILRPLVKRAKIPKRIEDLSKLHPGAPWPVLNAMIDPHGRHIMDYHLWDQAQLPDNVEIIRDTDLLTGQSIKVFGKDIFLYDCDEFTRWYYRETYGKDQYIYDAEDPPNETPKLPIPPHNGHGREEDSIQNCLRLIPQPELKDARKYLGLDRDANDPDRLIFRAKLVIEDREEKDRNFVLSYFINDMTIYVHEKESPEGFWEGNHFARGPIKVGRDPKTVLPQYVQPEQLYLGSLLNLREKVYMITEADEATMNFMDKYPVKFPFSNVEAVMKKVSKKLTEQNASPALCGDLEGIRTDYINTSRFSEILRKYVGDYLNPHEYQTLFRRYRAPPSVRRQECRQLLRSVIQRACRKELWEPAQKILMALRKLDPSQTGTLNLDDVLRALKAARIPVKHSVLEPYLVCLEESGRISYEEMVIDLDWVKNPAVQMLEIPQQVYGNDFDFGSYFAQSEKKVNHKDFLNDLQSYSR